MKAWSAPFAENINSRSSNTSRGKTKSLAGKMSSHVKALTTGKRVFFAILLLAVAAFTTKAMQMAAASDVKTTHTTAEAEGGREEAEPFVFGMEEPWGDGTWGYPKAEERSIKTS